MKKSPPETQATRSKEVNALALSIQTTAQKEILAVPVAISRIWVSATKARLAVLKRRVSARSCVYACINTRISGERTARTRDKERRSLTFYERFFSYLRV